MDKGMKILELYGELAKLLQDEELVKNLKELYKKHPEMHIHPQFPFW